jgi:uncharacterized membrane protein
MILMALDHARGFLSDARFNPLDLSRTTPALFLTRWVTHVCAPVFVFLAGTGAFLSLTRGKSRVQLAWFLLTRGLCLVALEFTLVHFGWCLCFEYRFFLAQVIYAIGCSMVILAALVFLPTWAVTLVGVVLIAGHDLLDPVDPAALGRFRWLWVALVSGSAAGGPDVFPSGVKVYVASPLLPWLGVMAAGYGFGRLWPHPWSPQASAVRTLLSFLDCQKYPPSLLFLLMTLGPSVLLLARWDRPAGPLGRAVITYGRVPLFFYLLHLPVVHLVALGLAFLRYGRVGFMLQNIDIASPDQLPDGYGYGLPVVYLVWLGVVLGLSPVCRWYAAFKARHCWAWLSYL